MIYGVYAFSYRGRIKIGWSSHIKQRLIIHSRAYRGMSPIGFIESPRNREMWVHRQMLPQVSRRGVKTMPIREWFEDCEENRAILAKLGFRLSPLEDRVGPAEEIYDTYGLDDSGKSLIVTSGDLHRKLKARARRDKHTLRAATEEALLAYLAEPAA